MQHASSTHPPRLPSKRRYAARIINASTKVAKQAQMCSTHHQHIHQGCQDSTDMQQGRSMHPPRLSSKHRYAARKINASTLQGRCYWRQEHAVLQGPLCIGAPLALLLCET
eukprot:1157567-Pelagomonas_calceolata.AAC.1